MNKLFAILLFSLALVGCKTTQPIYNAKVVNSTTNLTDEKMEKAINRALITRGWRVVNQSDNKIIATINVRTHSAEVEILYDAKRFSINYLSSNNLDYKPKKNGIHRNYNKWIKILENEIVKATYMISNT